MCFTGTQGPNLLLSSENVSHALCNYVSYKHYLLIGSVLLAKMINPICRKDVRQAQTNLRKTIYEPQMGLNLQPSDGCEVLTIEPPRLTW